MHIAIPEVNETLSKLMTVECTFEGRTQTISKWVMEHRNEITKNRNLLTAKVHENDIVILNIFLRDLLVRAIKGEMGLRVYKELIAIIKDKADLHETKSNFSPHYAAFDLHVTRVLTRIGWLNYGFPLVGNNDLEMGNNPGNDKNYLFLHSLFVLLSNMTGGKYTPVDLDRILWHLGKSKCGAKTMCFGCPIKEECLTGKYRTGNN